jgi:hypothetical protein
MHLGALARDVWESGKWGERFGGQWWDMGAGWQDNVCVAYVEYVTDRKCKNTMLVGEISLIELQMNKEIEKGDKSAPYLRSFFLRSLLLH